MNGTDDLRELDYVNHMIEASELARSYIEGMDKAAFLEDRKTQQAVIMNILIIGEAATKLADKHPEFTSRYPHIPWNSMRGMRNRLAHGYFEINLDVVWDTLRNEMPGLESALIKVRERISPKAK